MTSNLYYKSANHGVASLGVMEYQALLTILEGVEIDKLNVRNGNGV